MRFFATKPEEYFAQDYGTKEEEVTYMLRHSTLTKRIAYENHKEQYHNVG